MLFELNDVTKTYGRVVALRNLSVAAPSGAIGLLGPNGAGKTTMIRTLLGLIRFNSGTGQVLGKDIRSQRMQIRQEVGFAPEDECLFPGLQGIEFVAFAGELCGMPRSDALRRAHETLDYVGLGEARYRMAESYSTGMKQRLKVASAIVHDPKLLILDEPTNGLDPQGRDEMIALARDLAHNKGMSVLFSSHLLPDVETVCEHLIVMGGGQVLKTGRIEDLKKIEKFWFAIRVKEGAAEFSRRLAQANCEVQPLEGDKEGLLASPLNGADESLFWRLARESNIQIRSLRPQRMTLEQVFLNALQAQTQSQAQSKGQAAQTASSR